MDTALGHLRVIEVGSGAAIYCGHYLAELGADVLKVEPPGGDPVRLEGPFAGDIVDPERSLFFLRFNINKRSIVLDMEAADDRQVFKDLAATADIVVESYAPGYLDSLGIGYKHLRETNNGLVMVSLSPFGQTGPFRTFKGNNAVMEAMSGFLNTMGNNTQAPILSPAEFLSQVAGMHAAYYALAAIYYRRESGSGQYIDVSLQEVGTNMNTGLSDYGLRRLIRPRPRLGNIVGPSNIYKVKDGYVFTQPVTPRMWRAFAEWIGDPVLLQPEWESLEYRQGNEDIMEMITIPFAEGFTVAEYVAESQRKRIPATPLNPPEALLESEQAREIGSFVDLHHPVIGKYRSIRSPFRMSETPPQFRRPAPRTAEHREEIVEILGRERTPPAKTTATEGHRRLPLEGIRVLDFTRVLAGPTATLYLSFLGAEVIKVEELEIPNRDGTAVFADLNRGKKSVTVDLQKPEGRDLVLQLVSKSDVVIENFSAHVMERLGLGYEALRTARPEIVAISMPGFGRTGPLSEWGAYGPIIQANLGIYWMWRHADSQVEAGIRNPPLDYFAAAEAALATMSALEYREQTGKGQFIDLVMLEAGARVLGPTYIDSFVNGRRQEPKGWKSERYAPYGCYRCRGYDAWCVISCETDEEWKALVRVMGGPARAADDRFASKEARIENRADLDSLITEWTAQYTPRQVMHLLQREGVPAGVVQNAEDLYYDYHLRARGHIVSVSHPAPWGTFELNGMTAILSETPGNPMSPAPALGQHNQEIFMGLLGIPKETVQHLRERKVI